MKRAVFCILCIFLAELGQTSLASTRLEEANECVVLLHGLARTDKSMAKMEKYLAGVGFFVINQDYPSRKETIEKLVPSVLPKAIEQCNQRGASKIHFITHSMGGILVRYYLSRNYLPKLGRVVMLSPPNKGSEVVDQLKDFPGYGFINGPAGSQLGTDKESIPKKLKGAYYEVGIITGNRSINPVLSLLIPGEDDGKVSVKNAKLQGMTDFIVMPYSHPFIMKRKAVIRETIHFLKNGRFSHQ